MATRIRYLPIEAVTAGMVLGGPLSITEGGVTTLTFPVGHVLTESNLDQMLHRHAEWACIEEDDPRSDEERGDDLAAMQERQRKLFSRADLSQPAMAALFEAVLRYRSL